MDQSLAVISEEESDVENSPEAAESIVSFPQQDIPDIVLEDVDTGEAYLMRLNSDGTMGQKVIKVIEDDRESPTPAHTGSEITENLLDEYDNISLEGVKNEPPALIRDDCQSLPCEDAIVDQSDAGGAAGSEIPPSLPPSDAILIANNGGKDDLAAEGEQQPGEATSVNASERNMDNLQQKAQPSEAESDEGGMEEGAAVVAKCLLTERTEMAIVEPPSAQGTCSSLYTDSSVITTETVTKETNGDGSEVLVSVKETTTVETIENAMVCESEEEEPQLVDANGNTITASSQEEESEDEDKPAEEYLSAEEDGPSEDVTEDNVDGVVAAIEENTEVDIVPCAVIQVEQFLEESPPNDHQEVVEEASMEEPPPDYDMDDDEDDDDDDDSDDATLVPRSPRLSVVPEEPPPDYEDSPSDDKATRKVSKDDLDLISRDGDIDVMEESAYFSANSVDPTPAKKTSEVPPPVEVTVVPPKPESTPSPAKFIRSSVSFRRKHKGSSKGPRPFSLGDAQIAQHALDKLRR